MKIEKRVPFVDLVTPHVELEGELIATVREVIRSGAFMRSAKIDEFEAEFARLCGTKHCVGVSSGTDALRFALIAAGVNQGDLVVTVPNTFVATVEAIIQAGAVPQFVDIDKDTFNMSAAELRRFLETQCDPPKGTGPAVHRQTGRPVSAVVAVHLYGQMCDMDPIMTLAEEYGLTVVEDACQAHGSEYFSQRRNQWQKAGSVGRAGAFSFYVAKNLGACGEAGAVTTNDDAIAQQLRMIRDHGQAEKYYHLVEGFNGRLDAVQAAILCVKLPYLREWNSKRRDAASIYTRLLQTDGRVETPWDPEWSRSVYHLYVVLTGLRDELREHLSARQIETGLHYPVPLHLQPAYAHLGHRKGAFPVSEKTAGRALSLPMFPQIRSDQQEHVVEMVREFYESRVAVGQNG